MTIQKAAVLTLLLGVTASVHAQQPAPAAAPTPGIVRTPLLDNAAVTLTRIRFAPAAQETPHTHPFTLAIVLLGRGTLDLLNGESHQSGVVEPGRVAIVPPGVTHAAGNPGAMPWDLIAVAVKGHGPFARGAAASGSSLGEHADVRASTRCTCRAAPRHP